MKQQKEEVRGFSLSADRGRAKAWRNNAVAYSRFIGMARAHASRMYLYGTEGQGAKRACSARHNRARFPSFSSLIPRRERAHEIARENAKREKAKNDAQTALRFGRKYHTLTMQTIATAREQGIPIYDRADMQTTEEAWKGIQRMMARE